MIRRTRLIARTLAAAPTAVPPATQRWTLPAKLRDHGQIWCGRMFLCPKLTAPLQIHLAAIQLTGRPAVGMWSLAILPLPITVIVVRRRSVALSARIGTRTVVTGGMILVATGLAAMSFMTAATSYLPYGLALLVIAVGMGLSVPALSTGIVTSRPPAQAGTGSGLNSAVREVGSALGVAVIGTILTSRFAGKLPTELRSHAGSTSQTLRAARRLGADVHTQTVTASPTQWLSASGPSPSSFSPAQSRSLLELATPALGDWCSTSCRSLRNEGRLGSPRPSRTGASRRVTVSRRRPHAVT